MMHAIFEWIMNHTQKLTNVIHFNVKLLQKLEPFAWSQLFVGVEYGSKFYTYAFATVCWSPDASKLPQISG